MHLVSLSLKLVLSGFNSEQEFVLCKFSQKISEKMTAVCEVLWQKLCILHSSYSNAYIYG